LCASRHLHRLCSRPPPDAPVRKEMTDIVGQGSGGHLGSRERYDAPVLGLVTAYADRNRTIPRALGIQIREQPPHELTI
jgi:hypothetical protein